MGHYGGAPALKILNDSAASGAVDAIIHVGDFAYDLNTDGGKVKCCNFRPWSVVAPEFFLVGGHEGGKCVVKGELHP